MTRLLEWLRAYRRHLGRLEALAIVGWLVLAGCSSGAPAPATVARKADCDEAVGILLADKGAGLTCAQGKEHAALLVPGCPLVFTCPDGGQ